MKYCSRCILPDSRPNLTIGAHGVCNACHGHASRRAIDWKGRMAAFRKVVAGAKARSRGYDCLVPVSGGKDSHWQVAVCLEHGLRVLAVTWRPPARTDIGRANLENLVGLGVDHIDYSISRDVERRFSREAFLRCGSSAVPMHMAIFNIPLRVAAALSIPLVVWGENSAFEYGGTREESTGFALDERWLRGTASPTARKQPIGWARLTAGLALFRSQPSGLAAQDRAVFWVTTSLGLVKLSTGTRLRAENAKTRPDWTSTTSSPCTTTSKWHSWVHPHLRQPLLGSAAACGAPSRPCARGGRAPADIRKFLAFTGLSEREFSRSERFTRSPHLGARASGPSLISSFLIGSGRVSP